MVLPPLNDSVKKITLEARYYNPYHLVSNYSYTGLFDPLHTLTNSGVERLIKFVLADKLRENALFFHKILS